MTQYLSESELIRVLSAHNESVEIISNVSIEHVSDTLIAELNEISKVLKPHAKKIGFTVFSLDNNANSVD